MEQLSGLDVHESQYRIAIAGDGGAVLLDFDDWTIGNLKITPSREWSAEGYVEGTSKDTTDRGNRSHVISWQSARDCGDVLLALIDQLNRTKNLPAGGVDVTIELNGITGALTLNKATITAASSDTIDRFSIFTYTLIGGALTGDDLGSDLITDPQGHVISDPTGDPITPPT
jgi:hypothetical protein